MEPKKKIEFNRDVTQPIVIKKRDRLIISGPCEIDFYEVTSTSSLDFEIKATLSMPRENQVVKLKPTNLLSYQESGIVYQETKQRH
jgi:hypothetical protein